jgi:diguanylate cyclase (GGDEF)-like protein
MSTRDDFKDCSVNPHKSTRAASRKVSRGGESGAPQSVVDTDGRDASTVLLCDRLIAIGRAGGRAATLAEAGQAIASACRGIGSSESALLLLDAAVGKSIGWSDGVLGSANISPEDAAAVSTAVWQCVSSSESTDIDVFSIEMVLSPGPCHVLVATIAPIRDRPGALVLIRPGDATFQEGDRSEVRLASDQCVLALQQASVEEENQHRTTERQLVSRLTQTIVGMQDLGLVLSDVAAAVRTITGWDTIVVASHTREGDALSVDAVEVGAMPMPGAPQVGERMRLSDWQSLRFALDNCSPYVLSLDQSEALAIHERDHLSEFGIASLLAVPFALIGEAVGVVLLYSRTARSLVPGDLRIVQELAANAALAIQHSQFAAQARQQAEEQTALLRVSKAVISGKDLYVILAEIARASLGFEGVEGCRILLWHKERDRFEIGATQSVRDWQMYYQISDQYPAADWPTYRTIMKDKTARGYLVSDQEMSARERANHIADQIQSIHSFPISIGDDIAGVLSLLSRSKRRFGPTAVRIGHELSAQAAHAIDRARLFGQLRRRAETDGLTGLLNHRAAFETLDRELAAARKLDESLSIIIVDLDDFKLFNDTHGHLTGDQVLIEVAAALTDASRSRDYVARYGGDEFLLILPGTTRELSSHVAERLLRKMDGITVKVSNLELPIRVSIGVATFPHDASNRQELIAYGDAAMYSAKECGGGQLGTIEKRTRSLETTVFGALSGLVRAVDRKDSYTKDHSDMVAEYAVRFGRYLNLPDNEIDALDVAGQLHDIGKIAVPDSVLRKPGRLSTDEQALIRQHVVFSEMIIKGIPNLDHVQAAVAHHHERWDGTGYPNGKSGEEIPLLGRILTLADALAAMTHDRPYRRGRSREEALAEIKASAGTQFDPGLVDEFIAAVSTNTAILRDEHRRRRLNPHNVDPDNPPDVVGLTDYLRQRQEMRELPDEHRDSA